VAWELKGVFGVGELELKGWRRLRFEVLEAVEAANLGRRT